VNTKDVFIVLDKITLWIQRILQWVVALLLVVMSLIVFANVIFRYFLNAALGWYEEVSRFLLIWIVFLGAVLAYIHHDHLSLDVVLYYVKARTKRVIVLVSDALVIAALAVMVYGGFQMALDSLASGWVASAIPIPYGWVYMVGPIASILMLYLSLVKTCKDWMAPAESVKGGTEC
jgi:TRAP-type C4-dicarboxylate transport system permease small subunit